MDKRSIVFPFYPIKILIHHKNQAYIKDYDFIFKLKVYKLNFDSLFFEI